MKKRYEKASQKRKGAMFFIVTEGNFSRGSDYSNLASLGNIMVGVSFLYNKDPKISKQI